MFITIQMKRGAYVTSTTMLLFFIVAIDIDALVSSMHQCINTLFKGCISLLLWDSMSDNPL